MTPCSVDGCTNARAKGEFCWAHLKRRQRGKPLSAPLLEKASTPWESIKLACVKFADDTERPAGENPAEEMKRAEYALHRALYRYFVSKRGQITITTRDGKKR